MLSALGTSITSVKFLSPSLPLSEALVKVIFQNYATKAALAIPTIKTADSAVGVGLVKLPACPAGADSHEYAYLGEPYLCYSQIPQLASIEDPILRLPVGTTELLFLVRAVDSKELDFFQ